MLEEPLLLEEGSGPEVLLYMLSGLVVLDCFRSLSNNDEGNWVVSLDGCDRLNGIIFSGGF